MLVGLPGCSTDALSQQSAVVACPIQTCQMPLFTVSLLPNQAWNAVQCVQLMTGTNKLNVKVMIAIMAALLRHSIIHVNDNIESTVLQMNTEVPYIPGRLLTQWAVIDSLKYQKGDMGLCGF